VQQVIEFCQALRQKKWATDSTFVYIFEQNYGGDPRASEFCNALRTHVKGPSYIYEEMRKGDLRPGVHVDHDDKERYVAFWNQLMTAGRVCFGEEVHSKMAYPESFMYEQMGHFRREFRKSKNNNGEFCSQPYYYTGKGHGRSDDVMMAALFGAHCLERVLTDERVMAGFNKHPLAYAKGKFIPGENGGTHRYIEYKDNK
jgi:hypothetical protein